jgi:hypothetical protein
VERFSAAFQVLDYAAPDIAPVNRAVSYNAAGVGVSREHVERVCVGGHSDCRGVRRQDELSTAFSTPQLLRDILVDG